MVEFTEVDCGLSGLFGLETSCLPFCSVGAEETPVSGLSPLYHKGDFELETSQLKCMPIYSCSLSFLPPTLGI